MFSAKNKFFSALAIGIFLNTLAIAQPAEPRPDQNPALSAHQRAVDLVSRMTLEEKVSEMGNASAAIPRLGVPAYNFWNEALHGVARAGYATMFPQAIGMAATWDPPLFLRIGDTISTEARAKNNEALRRGNHDIYSGLTFWSPNINIFRDPRWGRGQETYGEDPYLTGVLAENFIRGLQGNDPRYYKVIATPKHYAVHSGPESERHRFNVDPSPHDLWDTYLPHFRRAIVDAKADSIMCAYNAVDGQPACGSKLLLADVLRHDWNFQGFVTSDCGAIDDFFKPNTHMTEPDAEHADRDALLAGTDTNCGSTYRHLAAAVRQGLVKESDVDTSVIRLFEARFKLGQFDLPEKVPYAQIPVTAVHSPENAALARRTAEESMVLLKNDGTLPLAPNKYKKIAVIGPNGANLASLMGNYNGTPVDPVMPVDAIRAAFPQAKIAYEPGAPFVDGFALPVPRSLLHPAAGSSEQGLKAEYFNSGTFSGAPVRTTVDPQINFDWDSVNPLPGHPAEGFAARWTGTIHMPQPGTYNFTLRAGPCRGCATDQSFKVMVDGKVVAESAPPLPAAGAVSTQINSITGLPQEARQQGPARFQLDFAEGQERTIEVDFQRTRADRGSGVTLEFAPPAGVLISAALQAARDSDLIIAMLGLSPNLEGEEMPVKLPGFSGGDRTDIALPESQEALLNKLADTGKPLVVVLLNGSALAINSAERRANAILEAWYPGEAGGTAIAETLTGANNPAGRLPVTFYKSTDDLPAFTDYSMKNRTYRYFAGQPLYAFGYGLSFTRFSYANLHLSSPTIKDGETLRAEVEVKNTGSRPGDEVAELYLIPPRDGNGGLSPKLQLGGVQRISLQPGETRKLTFELDPRTMSEVDAQGIRSVQPGEYRLAIGGAQPDDPKAPAQPQTTAFAITGSFQLPH